MKKEKKETILQQGVNMRISCLRPDIFLVCEATLETLFHKLRNETISYLSHPVITDFSLFQTFNLHGVTFNSDTITGQTNIRLTDCI